MRFEFIVRDRPGREQYAVLSDGETHEVVVSRWTAADDRVERLAVVVYPHAGSLSEARVAREDAIHHAYDIARRLGAGEMFDAQAALERAAPETRPRVSALRRRAEAAQDDAVRRR